MSECTHEGDRFWHHDEKRSYCCACRQPCGPRPIIPSEGGILGPTETTVFGVHWDHFGYQVDGGYHNCGADQT